MIEFFISINPPTATHQMKQVRVVNGRPVFYEPEKVKAARRLLCENLKAYSPTSPIEGAVELKVTWLFPKGKSHKNGQWRTTRPDTDNLQKLLKDCMTQCGFWKDDAQVVRETAEKLWSDEPVGIRIVIEELEANQNG